MSLFTESYSEPQREIPNKNSYLICISKLTFIIYNLKIKIGATCIWNNK